MFYEHKDVIATFGNSNNALTRTCSPLSSPNSRKALVFEHFYYIVMSEMAMRLAKLMCTMYLQGHDMERSTRTITILVVYYIDY